MLACIPIYLNGDFPLTRSQELHDILVRLPVGCSLLVSGSIRFPILLPSYAVSSIAGYP